MINKISIYYSDTEAHTFCLWKYFFEMCGIFVSEKKIHADTKKNNTGTSIFILATKDINWIKSEQKNRVYLIVENSTLEHLYERENVVIIQGEDMTYNHQVIEYLFSQDIDDMHEIEELMGVFLSEKLWGISWLFHNISHDNGSCFDKMIITACERAIKKLEQIKVESLWHANFMRLYCQYIKAGVTTHNLLDKMKECQRLIFESVKLAKT